MFSETITPHHMSRSPLPALSRWCFFYLLPSGFSCLSLAIYLIFLQALSSILLNLKTFYKNLSLFLIIYPVQLIHLCYGFSMFKNAYYSSFTVSNNNTKFCILQYLTKKIVMKNGVIILKSLQAAYWYTYHISFHLK